MPLLFFRVTFHFGVQLEVCFRLGDFGLRRSCRLRWSWGWGWARLPRSIADAFGKRSEQSQRRRGWYFAGSIEATPEQAEEEAQC